MPTPADFADSVPDKVAIHVVESGERMTYAELEAEANRVSRMLRDQGLGRGDHVAFCVENRAGFLAFAWGAHYAGCYYTAISSRLTPDEAGYIIGDCGARVVLCWQKGTFALSVRTYTYHM